jgi:hypothetical protein
VPSVTVSGELWLKESSTQGGKQLVSEFFVTSEPLSHPHTAAYIVIIRMPESCVYKYVFIIYMAERN